MPNPKPRLGLVLCSCGNNISETIDLDAIAAWAKNDSRISLIVQHELLCSPDGKRFLEETLKKNKLTHVVIAACSPRMHEQTFRTVAERTEVNPGMVQMANIREHDAWVTTDKAAATQKAIQLIKAAVTRSALQENLEQRSVPCNTDVVIIGGGIAGMEAALLASAAGRKVTIIEKNISLGGRVIHFEELAPNMECAPCLLSPRLFKIRDDANIKVVPYAEVLDVLGFYGNFTVKVKQKARYVKESCIGCEACFDVCPVSVKSDFHLGMGDRKAIYTLFSGSVPASAIIDHDHCLHFKDGSCRACAEVCPFLSVDFDDKDQVFEIPAGAIVVATGFEPFASPELSRLGWGRLPNVYTLPQIERLLSSNGPTQSQLRLANGDKPASIAILHCAGSLSEKGLPYCSGFCCLSSLKIGEQYRKQNADAKIIHVHDRLVFQQPDAQRFYEHERHSGTQWVVSHALDQLHVEQAGSQLTISGPDIASFTVDLVVLVTGGAPPKGIAELATMLNVELTPDGFFKPDHYFLRGMGSTSDGIYAVGGSIGPVLVRDAIFQAQAASGEVISRLVPGRTVDLESMTACIDSDRCAGCKMCISVCPYKAIEFDAERVISRINEAICHGCGTCAANCPSGAAKAKNFTQSQLEAELDGILND